jgi:hypothetical protein
MISMQSEQDKRFEENLAVGEAGEDIVYSYLVANNSFVEDLRKQKRSEGGGPRLKGTEGSLVSPDFAVYNKNPKKGNFAVDAKVKTSIYPVYGKKCFTVDSKYEQYKRVVQVKKLDFLMIVFIYEGRMYFYKDTECSGITTFRNQYSTGNVYLFEFDKSKIRY